MSSLGENPSSAIFNSEKPISKKRISLCLNLNRQRVRLGHYFALLLSIIFIQTKPFRQRNSRHYSFPQICYSLDLTCSGSWLAAAFIARKIRQVQQPLLSDTSCNASWVTIPLRHGMYLAAKSTQFISLKAAQNICTFLGTVPTAFHVTPQNTFFVLLK